jgi:hypothetical protein
VLQQTECGGIAKTVETACVLWDDAALLEAQHCIDWTLDNICCGTFAGQREQSEDLGSSSVT